MKLLDKIKDLFTDEIIEEKEEVVEVKEERNENKLPTIMREEKKEDNNIEKTVSDKDFFKDFENLELDFNNENNKFRFPISFEENEIEEENKASNQNIMYREKENSYTPVPELYTKKDNKEEKVTFFKVSPVISPVYGILDKNYKKEEVQSKPKSSKDISRNTQKIDFESVRKKAYGSLIDDIKENLAPEKEEIKPEKEVSFYELKENIDEITLGEIETNFSDFGITIDDYNKKTEVPKEENVIKFESREEMGQKIEISDPVIDLKKQDDDYENNFDKENNDIFNLIDNMYINEEEKND